MIRTAVQRLSGSSRSGSRYSSVTSPTDWSASPGKYDELQVKAMEENCILIDEDDKAIGSDSKYNCHRVDPETGALKLHRAFSVFLFNSAGELLLQRRSKEKITYPDTFTNTCCSHPLYDNPDECIEQNQLGVRKAAQRRLNIELGIPTSQVRPEDFHCVRRLYYEDKGDGVWGEHEITQILILQKDFDINPNPNEVSEVRYVKRSELDAIISNLEVPLTPWFKLIYQNCLKNWWDNLKQLEKIENDTILRF